MKNIQWPICTVQYQYFSSSSLCARDMGDIPLYYSIFLQNFISIVDIFYENNFLKFINIL